MIHLLKADFYRLFRSKSLYICGGIATFLMVVNIIVLDWSNRLLQNMGGDFPALMPYESGLSYGISSFTSGQVILFAAIVISIFIASEFSHGTMKNTVSKGFPRYQIYLSKLITMVVATYLMLIIMFLGSLISGIVVIGSFGVIEASMFGVIAIELLLNAAMAAVFVAVAMAVKNNGAVIAINIVILMFGALPYQIAEILVQRIFDKEIRFTKIGLQNNIVLYDNNFALPSDDVIRSIIVGVAFLVITSFFGYLVFRNTDVK